MKRTMPLITLLTGARSWGHHPVASMLSTSGIPAHLGLWFNSPKDAVAAGCAGATTPFNGEHDAGVQALSTRNFPDLAGPLRQVHS